MHRPTPVRMFKHTVPLLMSAATIFGQDRLPPRFEDYATPTGWKSRPVALMLRTHSEVFFHRPLLDTAREPPNFATQYRFNMWLCGATCLSGAIVDLATGRVIHPPMAQSNSRSPNFNLCQSAYEGSGVEVRPNSRLMIVHCGLNYSAQSQPNMPDVYYFVFEAQHFRWLAHLHRSR